MNSLLVTPRSNISALAPSVFIRNIRDNNASLSSNSDLNVLFCAINRLSLHPDDSLSDLNVSPDERCLAASVAANADPVTLAAAMKSPNKVGWQLAMEDELNSLVINDTFDLNARSTQATSLSCKWVFRTKINADGSTKFKARLVARGFQQEHGIDYFETYAPVAAHTTFRMLLATACIMNWEIRQLDVVTAFLNPEIDNENIWILLPAGCIEPMRKLTSGALSDIESTTGITLRLKKALYGLKQSPRLWWKKIDGVLIDSLGFTRAFADTNLYFLKNKLMLLLYVDDIAILNMEHPSCVALDLVISQLTSIFKMKDLGRLRKFLGFEIDYTSAGATIGQQLYIDTLVERYNILQAKPTTTPMDVNFRADNGTCMDNPLSAQDKVKYQSVVGALLYAALGTRPDIAYSVSALSRHCSNPRSAHLTAAMRVIKYLNTTRDYTLLYPNCGSLTLQGACDADWASSTIDRKSVGGYCFKLGDCLISWKAKRQTMVALSSLEAELMACSEASREAVWRRSLLNEVLDNGKFEVSSGLKVSLRCDNQGALATILKGTANLSARTKHIDI